MDPQHRVLLEATVEVLQGVSVQLPEATGVMVGLGSKETGAESSALPLSQYSATGAAASVAPGRWDEGCQSRHSAEKCA